VQDKDVYAKEALGKVLAHQMALGKHASSMRTMDKLAGACGSRRVDGAAAGSGSRGTGQQALARPRGAGRRGAARLSSWCTAGPAGTHAQLPMPLQHSPCCAWPNTFRRVALSPRTPCPAPSAAIYIRLNQPHNLTKLILSRIVLLLAAADPVAAQREYERQLDAPGFATSTEAGAAEDLLGTYSE
jgi:hypothetical protein